MVNIHRLMNAPAVSGSRPKKPAATGADTPFQKIFRSEPSSAGSVAKSNPVVATAKAQTSQSTPAASPSISAAAVQPPTAESVFGENPWVANPTGTGPFGIFGYNPLYFATSTTAQKVAQLMGGQVVSGNQITGSGGGYGQQQPNLMVQLSSGRAVNAGIVASFYTHGYPQSYIDKLLAAEVAGTAV